MFDIDNVYNGTTKSCDDNNGGCKSSELCIEDNKEKTKEPTTVDVRCVRRHLNDEYKRAIEVDEVITLSTKYAKYLISTGLVK